MRQIPKIFANEFTYATVQKSASQTGSKSSLASAVQYKFPPNAKNRKKTFLFLKKLFFLNLYCYADAKPLPQTLFEEC